MGEDLSAVAERMRRDTWPDPRRDGETLRAFGTRRGRVRRGAASLAAVALVGAVAVIALPSGEPAPDSAASDSPQVVSTGGGGWTAFGVSLRLPAAWTMQQVANAGPHKQACVRGPDATPACVMRLVVTATPDRAISEGVDVFREMDSWCLAQQMELRLTRSVIGGRPAARFTGRCSGGPPMTAWALDNRTAALVVETPAPEDASHADRIFASLVVPAAWPQKTADVAVASAEPSAGPLPAEPSSATAPPSATSSSRPPPPPPADAYVFPVAPGTAEWNALKSHDAMLRALQIPPPLLAKMSTAGLVDTVLRYPLAGDIHAFSTRQQGFDAVASNFNGLSALLERPDALQHVLGRYAALDPGADLARLRPGLEHGNYVISYTLIELVLAQEQVWSPAPAEQRASLLQEAKRKLAAKARLSDVFGQSGLETTQLIIDRLKAAN